MLRKMLEKWREDADAGKKASSMSTFCWMLMIVAVIFVSLVVLLWAIMISA